MFKFAVVVAFFPVNFESHFFALRVFPRHPNKLIILWGKENNSCQTKVFYCSIIYC